MEVFLFFLMCLFGLRVIGKELSIFVGITDERNDWKCYDQIIKEVYEDGDITLKGYNDRINLPRALKVIIMGYLYIVTLIYLTYDMIKEFIVEHF